MNLILSTNPIFFSFFYPLLYFHFIFCTGSLASTVLGSSPVTSFITSFSAFYLLIFCPSSTLLPDPYPLPAHAFPAPLSTFTLWPVFLLLFLGILFLFRSTCMTIGFMHEYEGDGRGWLKVMVSFLSFCSIFFIPYPLFFILLYSPYFL